MAVANYAQPTVLIALLELTPLLVSNATKDTNLTSLPLTRQDVYLVDQDAECVLKEYALNANLEHISKDQMELV